MAKKKLTNKQEQFCREYIIDFNATQAAIRAGYSKKTSHAIGQENLRKPIIKHEITLLTAVIRQKVSVTVEMITDEFKKLAFKRASKTLTNKNKISALENLGKHIGYYGEDNAQRGKSLAELISEAVGSK